VTSSPQLTAITAERYSGKAWRRYNGYAFAAKENLIALVAAELANAVPAMPVGFVQTGEAFQLVAVTGLEPGVNLFVAPDGRWLGSYVPATLRGYPFRLVKVEGREESLLCIDEASGLVVETGLGEPFFDETGQPAQALKQVLDFLSQVERSRMATQAAVDALAAAGLIQPWPLNIKRGEQQVAVTGLYRIDEAALHALDDKAFLGLRASGALPVAYAQLMSINQLAVLERLTQVQAKLQAQASRVVQKLAGLEGIGLSQDDGTLKFD
jgi:hypothetical protein